MLIKIVVYKQIAKIAKKFTESTFSKYLLIAFIYYRSKITKSPNALSNTFIKCS